MVIFREGEEQNQELNRLINGVLVKTSTLVL